MSAAAGAPSSSAISSARRQCRRACARAPTAARIWPRQSSVSNATVFIIGANQALYDYCPAQGRPEQITGVIAPTGTVLTAATVAGNPIAAFFTDHKMVMESEIPYPCTPINATIAANVIPPVAMTWQPAGGIAAAGFADGGLAVLATATDGSVHELSWQPNIGWTDTTVVPAGGASAAHSLAAAPVPAPTPGANPNADMLELFYADGKGRLWKTRLALGAGAADPVPLPLTVANAVPVNAPLAAAAGSLGIYVSYVDGAGEARIASVDPASDSWRQTEMVSAPNTAPAGSATALGVTADEIDVFCAGNAHQAGYDKFAINTAGPGVWLSESGPSLLDANGSIAAG